MRHASCIVNHTVAVTFTATDDRAMHPRAMNIFSRIAAAALSLALFGCGGGGGSAGTTTFGAGAGATAGSTTTGSTGSSGTVSAGTAASAPVYAVAVEVDRSTAATTQITSTETVQAVATVTADGKPVEGMVVSFTEVGGTLLTFAPTAATALSGTDGRASVDVKAAAPASTGATTVQAAVTAASGPVSATKSFQITAGAVTPGTPPVPGAINFVGSTPSGTAIVVKGAGGNGRSESAILTFRIVDVTSAPIDSATVDFALNANSGGATISQSSAVSNSSGLVTVSVASGSQPASIVVTATAHALTSVSSQSDTLLVSNSVPVPQAFELAAATYNLDGHKTGSTTSITAYVADANGNPVPDGVAVSFQTDLGVVASSTLGGCLTVNGKCSVDFGVQDPRGNGLATVVGTIRVGSSTTLSDSLPMHIAGPGSTPYLAVDGSNRPVTQLTMSTCKQAFELLLSDGTGHATASGTSIQAGLASTGIVVSVPEGSPVADQLTAGFPATVFGILVDLTSTTGPAPACNASGAVAASGNFFNLTYRTPGDVVFTQRFQLAYPQ